MLKVKIPSSCQFIAVVLQSSETQGQSVSRGGKRGARGLFRPCLKTSFLAPFFCPDPTDCLWVSEDEVNRECLLLNLVPVALCGPCGWALQTTFIEIATNVVGVSPRLAREYIGTDLIEQIFSVYHMIISIKANDDTYQKIRYPIF